MKNFDELLKKYADFIVRVGVNPQPGQVLIINCALEGAPLARLCVRSAFEAGARDVQVNWTDDAVTRTRMELGSEEALTDHKGWQLRRYLDYAETEGGVCVLHLIADDPALVGITPRDDHAFFYCSSQFVEPCAGRGACRRFVVSHLFALRQSCCGLCGGAFADDCLYASDSGGGGVGY